MKSASRMHEGTGRPTVFVLDDEPSILSVLGRALRRAGYEVATYGSPRAFLEEARLVPPCCIVLDLHMPEISGVEIQCRLAAVDPPPPIVFISGAADVGSTVKAMKAGAVDFLTKPFEPKDLLAAVAAAVARSEAQVAQRAEADRIRGLLGRLTPREREVCDLMVRGLRSKEIAERLGAAVKTVNIHRSRIMTKLGATTVVELVRLLEPSSD
jgi:FixJ family two-component response regulator